MIVVRDIFQLHFGKAREALEMAREGTRLEGAAGNPIRRMMTDVVGEYYTLVLESEYDDLGEFERRLREGTGSQEWKDWYARFTPLVREGRREIHRIVE